MTTPQRTFSEANQASKEMGEPIILTAGRSIYCADCLCGRHFETSSGEWVCPDCHRHIVLDWACSREPDPQSQYTRQDATTQELAYADPL
jgi:hypothetical protein